MEVPKKIYVHVKGDKVTNIWNRTWIGVHDVEYIRKDAFIEKACEWLNDNLHHYWGSISADPHNFLFDFRKAMEK